MKRLFSTGILPEKLIARPVGKHWKVSFSDEELQYCKASLALWSVWRRKPRASKIHARRDELSSTALRLILAEAKNSDEQDLRSPQAQIGAFFRALSVLNTKQKDVEAVWWNQQILGSPTKLVVAAFILRTAVAQFRKKHARQPTRKQLAEALQISERSIYRFPFGKNTLELAYLDRNLAKTKDEERAEETADPQQSEYDRMARNDYAQLHQRQIAYRDYIDHGTKRKLRKRKAHSFELAWEEHSAGNVRGGALLIFPVAKLQAKRRIEMSDQLHGGLPWTTKRHVRQRQFRQDIILGACDETFGSWAVAAYVVEPDGKCRWWTNFEESTGRTHSATQARREILCVISRYKTRVPIVNLRQMLGESRISGPLAKVSRRQTG